VEADAFPRATARSRAAFERAERWIAGGTNLGGASPDHPPLFIERGEGCFVFDVDGNRYIDFINSSFALPFGHAFAPVREAVARQLEKGTFFTAPTECEARLAELLCQRVPGIERLKFCSSGSEAAMFAVRAARALTGRPRIAKMAGGFHGTSDSLSTSLGIMSAGVPFAGGSDPEKEAALGIPAALARDVVLLSFNDERRCEAAIERQRRELAAVLVEPVMGAAGMIPARREFLQFLREITRRHGILLVFDEMISLGIAPGGAQEYYGVIPDLTCCGKIIGGGLPIGCLGGRAELMEIFDLRRHRPAVNHGGTFAAHPLAMVAGAAQLEALTPEVYRRLHELGDRLRAALADLFETARAPLQVTGVGQLFCYHLNRRPVASYEAAAREDLAAALRVGGILTREGIHQASTSRGSVSTGMGAGELLTYVEAMATAIGELGLAGAARASGGA